MDFFRRLFESKPAAAPEPPPPFELTVTMPQTVEPAPPQHVTITHDYSHQKPEDIGAALHLLMEAGAPGMALMMDRYGFVSQNSSIRDLSDQARLSILRRAEWQSTLNPLGNRGMDMRTAMVVSEGFAAEPEDEKFKDILQPILDEHWELNEWEERMEERIRDLGVTGEMIRRIPDTKAKLKNGETIDGGRFKASVILPHYVHRVECNPDNHEELSGIYVMEFYNKTQGKVPGGQVASYAPTTTSEPVRYDILRKEWYGESAGMYSGDVMYLGVNRKPGATRGLSDLVSVAEWIEQHDMTMMTDAERAQLMLRFIYDVTLLGAGAEDVNKRAEELRRHQPRPGTIKVHNEKEAWKTESPSLAAAEIQTLTERQFGLAWGGLGLPKHWFYSAEDTNRATGINMMIPTFAWARTRRKLVMMFLRMECEYAIQKAILADPNLSKIPIRSRKVKIMSRDPDRTAYDTLGSAISQYATGLVAAVEGQILKRETATRVLCTAVEALGVDLSDIEKEIPELGQPAPAEGEEDTLPPNAFESVMRATWRQLESRRPELMRIVMDQGTVEDAMTRALEESAASQKKSLASESHKSSSKEKQDYAREVEMSVLRKIGYTAQRGEFGNTHPVEGYSADKKHAIEVKCFVDNSNDKITMHPESLARKRAEAAAGVRLHTVLVDDRDIFSGGANSDQHSGHRIYYRAGAGSFRVGSMRKVRGWSELRELCNSWDPEREAEIQKLTESVDMTMLEAWFTEQVAEKKCTAKDPSKCPIHGNAKSAEKEPLADKLKSKKKPASDEQEAVKDQTRVARAQASRKECSKEKQDLARTGEQNLAKGIGGEHVIGNRPPDITLKVGDKLHGIECKTMTDSANGKITMSKDAQGRKTKWEKDTGGMMHTVVLDRRDPANEQIYYRSGFGSFRITSMEKIENYDQLRERILAGKKKKSKK